MGSRLQGVVDDEAPHALHEGVGEAPVDRLLDDDPR